MELVYQVERKENDLEITLKGFLNANNSTKLLEEIRSYVGTDVKKVIFNMEELEYIASAGIRIIIFAKQKIGYDSDIVLRKPQEAVLSVLTMSGMADFLYIDNE